MSRRKSSPLANPADQHKSRLMGLPAELRNRIYHYVFEGSSIRIPARRKHNRKGLLKAPGLLVSCKQAHAEAIMIYYSTVSFKAPELHGRGNTGRLSKFLKTVGQQKVDLIHSIRVGPSTSLVIPSMSRSNTVSLGIILAELFLDNGRSECSKLKGKVTLKGGVLKAALSLPGRQGGFETWWTSEPGKVGKAYLDRLLKEDNK